MDEGEVGRGDDNEAQSSERKGATHDGKKK